VHADPHGSGMPGSKTVQRVQTWMMQLPWRGSRRDKMTCGCFLENPVSAASCEMVIVTGEVELTLSRSD